MNILLGVLIIAATYSAWVWNIRRDERSKVEKEYKEAEFKRTVEANNASEETKRKNEKIFKEAKKESSFADRVKHYQDLNNRRAQ